MATHLSNFYLSRPPRHTLVAATLALALSALIALTIIPLQSALMRRWIPWWADLLYPLSLLSGGVVLLVVNMRYRPELGPVPLALLSSAPLLLVGMVPLLVTAAAVAGGQFGKTGSPPQSATPSPVTSVRVVTVSGAIVTQTVTSTPFVVPNSNADAQPLQRKQLSGGAIAGIVIGTLLGLAALLLLAFLLLRRRKQNRDSEGLARGPTSPRRNISVLSRTGLLSRGRPTSMAENTAYAYDDAANPPTGQNSVRHSMLFGAAGAGLGGVVGVSPVSPLGSSHDNDNDGDRRYSGRPMVYDQRLNPSALFANAEANGSRVSMQDQRDYSRPLGVANPDPRPSFESRG
ncbi:hypothetical protein B0A55_01778 [Friedmanniomyces simplex]|uniref:Uncharacterized protein n=1 Tax=Friedmanniomyces simplex TaxID=329884 RepID=A0A4U0Y235_9PEZI|nr:hypothetical protein B0A55_01778 [Friedmanniomyces simplex]